MYNNRHRDSLRADQTPPPPTDHRPALDHAYARAGAAVVGRAEALGCDVLLMVQPAEGAAGPPQRVSLRGSGGASGGRMGLGGPLWAPVMDGLWACGCQASPGMLIRPVALFGASKLGIHTKEASCKLYL